MRIAWIIRSKKRKEHSVENVFNSIKVHFNNESYSIKEYYLPEDRWNSFGCWKKNIGYSQKIKSDILHITGEVYYVGNFVNHKKLLITLLDYALLKNSKGLKWLFYYLFAYGIPLYRSRYVVCISKSVMDETIKRYPFCKKKIKYIPCPVSDMYSFEHKEFNKITPNILVVGTQYNKNIERIITSVRDIQCKLTIIGRLNDSQLSQLSDYHIEYINKFNISNSEIIEEYKKSDLVCFPSTYEGFGMPIVEAQVTGRPVLTSNISPMNDISGGEKCACLINPFSSDDIREGIKRIIDDDAYRESLIMNGKKNAEKYSSINIANEYAGIYKLFSF